LIRNRLLPTPGNAPRSRRRNHSPLGKQDAIIASMRLISALKIDCGVDALSSSAAERGSAIVIVAVAISATIIDRNQEKTYIANLVK
jgi:hypothetical protein